MGRDDSDLTGRSRRRGWLRSTATLSAVVLTTGMAVVTGTSPSWAATRWARSERHEVTIPGVRSH